jgi:hypothetical protein
MRSELIFGAEEHTSTRFLMPTLKATRRLNRPNSRIEDTANDVFRGLCQPKPVAGAPCTSSLLSFSRAAQGESPYRYMKRYVV